MTGEQVAYRYIGEGRVYRGVPPRDLTRQEFNDLGLVAQREVLVGGGYEEVRKETKKERETREAAEQAAQEAALQAVQQAGDAPVEGEGA